MRILTTISRQEQLFLLRKRSGLTQVEFAKKYNVRQPLVCLWETNKNFPIPLSVLPKNALLLDKIKPHEELILLRRKLGLLAHLAAYMMKVSRMHLWKAENGWLEEIKLEPFFAFYKKRLEKGNV